MLTIQNEKCTILFFVSADENQTRFLLKKVYILNIFLNKLTLLSILINEYENNAKNCLIQIKQNVFTIHIKTYLLIYE